jgi:hypothetical protein
MTGNEFKLFQIKGYKNEVTYKYKPAIQKWHDMWKVVI